MRTNFGGVFGEIDSLPGCSQVGVSHAVYVPASGRNDGAGTLANTLRTGYMRETLGYDYALCTVNAANDAQIHLLMKNGWTRLDAFDSSKTGHHVTLWGKRLS